MNDTAPADAKLSWLSVLGVTISAGQTSAATSPPQPPKVVDLTKAAEQAAKDVVGTSTDVPRDQVERALKKFLHDLGTAQKSKTAVRTTDKVWMAESALRQGLPGVPVVVRGESRDYDPDDLAHKIAVQLPDTIPGANYLAFLKLKPVDIAEAGSITDQLHKKYEEERDAIIRKLPKEIQGLAKKAMDAAVEKGVIFVADQALKAGGVNSKIEGEMKKAVEDYVKKVTGGDSGGGDKEHCARAPRIWLRLMLV